MTYADRMKYHGDVEYEVWRSGGDPDRVDYSSVEDNYFADTDVYDAAAYELRSQMAEEHSPEEEVTP